MSKSLQNILSDLDALEAFGKTIVQKAKGLRTEVLHFHAGPHPVRGKRINHVRAAEVTDALRKSLMKKRS